MARNIEIKAYLPDRAETERRAMQLADNGPTRIVQHDTFFAAPLGRLKLRKFGPDHAQLIGYQRADIAGNKTSHYILHETRQPESLKAALALALPVIGEVKKVRTLYLVGQTRIHLDEVENLGSFIELEVVLREDQSEAEGAALADALCQQLGIIPDQQIAGAYLDLQAAGKPTA